MGNAINSVRGCLNRNAQTLKRCKFCLGQLKNGTRESTTKKKFPLYHFLNMKDSTFLFVKADIQIWGGQTAAHCQVDKKSSQQSCPIKRMYIPLDCFQLIDMSSDVSLIVLERILNRMHMTGSGWLANHAFIFA